MNIGTASDRFFFLMTECECYLPPAVKELRQRENGDIYAVIYLKMVLSSIEKRGIFIFRDKEKTIGEELSDEIEEDAEYIDTLFSFLIEKGQIIELSYLGYIALISGTLNIEKESKKDEKDKN